MFGSSLLLIAITLFIIVSTQNVYAEEISWENILDNSNFFNGVVCCEFNQTSLNVGNIQLCESSGGRMLHFGACRNESNCYLELSIGEQKVNDKLIFSLLGANLLQGNQRYLINELYETSYQSQAILSVDSNNKFLALYGYTSPRFLLYDFENKSFGIEEFESGEGKYYIPYDLKIKNAAVYSGNNINYLNFDYEFISDQFVKLNCSAINEVTCKAEGESIPVALDPPSCCPGLKQIPSNIRKDTTILGICTAKCGDKVCDPLTESRFNCRDCIDLCTINPRLPECMKKDECSPSWECTLKPIICPEYGEQEKTCTELCSGNTTVERIECSPGICSGCYLDNDCIKYGLRFPNENIPSYCDIDGIVKSQKTADLSTCQNNYECESNLCSYGECINTKLLAEQAKGFNGFVVKVLCKLSNIFDDASYAQCIIDNS